MLSSIVHSIGKPSRLVCIILLAFGLLLVASPGSAAGPQSQPPQVAHTPDAPNASCPPDGQCFADVLPGNVFYDFINRIYQQDLVSGYPCGGPNEPCDDQSRPYYRPVNNVTRQQMAKFIDNARRLPEIYMQVSSLITPIYVSNTAGTAINGETTAGTALWGAATSTGIGVKGTSTGSVGVYGQSSSDDGIFGTTNNATHAGVYGTNTSGNSNGFGVEGQSSNGSGVHGDSTNGYGVTGISNSSYGVYGQSTGSRGVVGDSTDGFGVLGQSVNSVGVYGYTANPSTSWAGYFQGDINVTGNCIGCLGSSKIDDPLDPANKYLLHSAVQSPDMMDVYNGNITTDDKGEATVQMPAYFEALNRDFRYQLTVMGQFAQAIVGQEIKDGKFVIKTDKPNVKVSWQVTGIRQDAYNNAHRIPVEEEKPADEKGKYLHPTELGQPASSGIGYEEQQKMLQAAQSRP